MKYRNFLFTVVKHPYYYIRHIFLFLFLFPGIALAQTGNEEDKARALAEYIDGIVLFENGDIEKALDKLTAAYLTYSDDAGITYALSSAYLSTGDLTNAAYYGQMSTRMEPENRWYLLNMAEIYSRSGRQEMALNSLQAVLDLNPADTNMLYLISDAYTNLGRLEEANSVLDKIIALTGSSFELHLKKFQNYNALRQDDNALAELEKMRELEPGNLVTLHRLSQYYLNLGQLEKAQNILEEALARNPNDIRTTLLLGEIYINNENWQDAGELFLKTIEDAGVPPSGKMDLIRFLHLQQNRHPQVEALAGYIRESVDIMAQAESEYGPAQLFAAEYYLNQNQQEKALRTLEQVTAIAPDNAEAWAQRLQILFSNQQYSQVISLADTAEENAPDNPYIRFFAGAAHMLEKNYAQAEHWLTQASLLSAPREFRSVIYSTLADVKAENSNWDEAKSDYERAIRLHQDNHNALNNYAYYLSLQEADEHNLEQALNMAKRALAMEPENPSYLDTAGWIYFKTGNTETAREYIQKALDAGAESPEIFEHMGDILNAEGNKAQAIYWWEKALEADPDRTYLREQIEEN